MYMHVYLELCLKNKGTGLPKEFSVESFEVAS